MKVVAFNGGARKDGNPATMGRWVFAEVETHMSEVVLKSAMPCACGALLLKRRFPR